MRRRRNADALPSDDSAASSATPRETDDGTGAATDTPNSLSDAGGATPGDNAAGAEQPQRPRRRSSGRRRENPDDAAASADAVAPAAEERPTPEPAPAEKPRRAPRRRAARGEAPESETPAAPTNDAPAAPASASVEPAPILAAPPAAPTEAPAEGSGRRPRRRSSGQRNRTDVATGNENTPAADASGSAAPVAESGKAAKPAADQAAPPQQSRRGGGGGGGSQAGSNNRSRGGRGGGGGGATPAGSASAGGAGTAPDGSPSTSRTRGLRRNPSAGSNVVAPLAPAPPTAPAAAGGADTEAAAEADKPKRVRGLRRPPVARPEATPAAAPAAPAVTAAASEPIPQPYQPLPAETLARLPETRVTVQNGVAELIVNGEARLPLWFFVNTEPLPDAAADGGGGAVDASAGRTAAIRQIRMAYEAGIRFFTLHAHLPWSARSGERRYEMLDAALQFVAENAPDAFILPRLIFSPPASWERTHPDEMTRYVDDSTGDVSFASRSFWEGEAEAAVRAAVERVAQGPHAQRVFGFYLEHGEWFCEKGRGYDVSPANQTGFRSWLRQKYRNNTVAFRAAWHDGAVTFETAEVPSTPPPAGPSLFLGPRDQRWIDANEYSSDVVAQVLLRLGRAVKEASGGRSAVAASYGYTLELARAASGHLALAQVLASPAIDILTGPVSYTGRTPGGAATFPCPIDSITLAGKLWVSEDDSKTHLASDGTPDVYNPKIGSLEGTRAVQSRNFGAAVARGTGISWMDLWGEGWLDDREVWQGIAYLRTLAETIAARRRGADAQATPAPDVAVIVDERSFFAVRSDEFLLDRLIAQVREPLLRSGARIGFYLLSDLARPDFPDTPKLLLFLNAYRIPTAVRMAIKQRYQDDGRTLVWLYAPGAMEQLGIGDSAAARDMTEVLGMQLRLQPWASRVGTQILSSVRSPLTDTLRGQKIGEEARFNPTYFVTDPKAVVLGEYASTGHPSIAVRKHARWQSVFIGEPSPLTVPLLRGLYRLAGVPTYTVDDDAAWIGDALLCLHSAPGGGTTVYLPEEGVLVDLLTGETLASGGYGARLSMPPRGTRLLFHGSPTVVARFGIDPDAGPPGLTAEELPPAPPPFAFESAAAVRAAAVPAPHGMRRAESPVDVDPDDAALFEAAVAGTLTFADTETVAPAALAGVPGTPAADDPANSDANSARKRRRRRRRGRGRRGDAEDGVLDGTGPSGGESGDGLLGEDDEGDEDEGDDFTDIETVADFSDPVLYDTTAPRSVGSAASPLLKAEAGPIGRSRPSLEELLPQSDLPDGSELPPIPDEFLPLADNEFHLPGVGETDSGADGEADAEEAGRRGARRGRRGGGAAGGGGSRYRRSSGGGAAPAGDATVVDEIPLEEDAVVEVIVGAPAILIEPGGGVGDDVTASPAESAPRGETPDSE
jgi:hypothetical protein